MTTHNTTVASLLEEWDEGLLSRASLAWLLLCCAPLHEPEALLDAVPLEARKAFVRELERFPLGGGAFMVADRLEPPSEPIIAALREALTRRPAYLVDR